MVILTMSVYKTCMERSVCTGICTVTGVLLLAHTGQLLMHQRKRKRVDGL